MHHHFVRVGRLRSGGEECIMVYVRQYGYERLVYRIRIFQMLWVDSDDEACGNGAGRNVRTIFTREKNRAAIIEFLGRAYVLMFGTQGIFLRL
jgi:hypothetical protein